MIQKSSIYQSLANQFELSHGAYSKISSMEGLRGFAVFLVFLVHYSSSMMSLLPNDQPFYSFVTHLHSLGNIGVDLFFILSGYLIYGMQLKRKTRFFDYLQRRIQRIYPTFIAVFVIYLVITMVDSSSNKLPNEWFDAIVYVAQNILLLPGLFNIDPLITVAWSLSYEFFYYLLMPLLFFILPIRKWRFQTRMTFILLVTTLGFLVSIEWHHHIRLLMFLSGIIVYELVNHSSLKLPKYVGTFSLLAAIIWSVICYINLWHLSLLILGLFLFFGLLCWECFSHQRSMQQLFSWTPIRWLGNISYSYYLIHGLAIHAFFFALHNLFPNLMASNDLFFWLIIPCFTFTFIISTLLFIGIEKPLSLSIKKQTVQKAIV